jgi:hypothetical protein
MPSSFKKSIRGLLASVRSSVMDAAGASLDDAIKKITRHQHARGWQDTAFACIIKSDDGAALLYALQNDARVYKVSHYKRRPRLVFKDVAEHEFVIVHLRHGRQDLIFRLDRSVGAKKLTKDGSNTKDTPEKSPEVDNGSGSFKSHSHVSSSDSPSSSRVSSSRSSSSIGSIIMYPALLVDYCVCRMSNILSHERWARDTVVNITKLPTNCYELKTIDYDSSSSGPSLWDLVHIVEFVHKQCDNYDTMDAQCYWFADTIMAVLEDWGKDTKVTPHHGWKGIRSKILSIPAPGTLKGLTIYKRDVAATQTQKAGLTEYIKASTQVVSSSLSPTCDWTLTGALIV